MNEFFSTDERIDQLKFAVNRWLGTPWSANARACGKDGGVSCHNLPREIYMSLGALPYDFPTVRGDPTGSRHAKKSVIADWLNKRPEFKPLDLTMDKIQPGDLLGIRICRVIDHLGIVLPDYKFVHVLMHKKTDIDQWNVPPWHQRIGAVWRPQTL